MAALARDGDERRSLHGPATGRDVGVNVVDIIRLSAGKAVDHWGVADRLGLLEQLGTVSGDERSTA